MRYGTLLAALFLAAQAYGLDLGSDIFELRGFGTLGATHSSEDRADLIGNFLQADGAGHTHDWAASVDSRAGLQLDAQFDEQWSSVIQVVSQYNYRGTYEPDVEWAYIDYALTPELNIRAGRILTATFMEAENQKVGYTYDWVRPPRELYGVYPLTNKDGIELRYRFASGDASNTVQFSYGRTHEKFRGDGVGTADPTWNIHYLWESGPTALRIGYVDMTLDVSSPQLDGLFDGMRQFSQVVPGPAGQQAAINAERFRTDDTRYRIFTAGASHQIGNWRLQAEWANADMDAPTAFAGIRAWYASAAYRWGDVTPYVVGGSAKARNIPRPTPIPVVGLPLPLAQAAAQLNAGLDAVISTFAFTEDSLAAGVRWDIASDIDLKVQLERLRTGDGTSGRLANVQPDFESGATIHVVSFTVDFIF